MVPVPQPWSMILGSAENEGKLPRTVRGLARSRQCSGVVEPVGGILIGAAAASRLNARCYLISIRLVRRSFQYPSQSVRDGQPGRHPPGILPVELVIIDGVTSVNRRALGQRTSVAREVINTVTLREDPHDDRCRAVVVRAEVLVHRRIAIVERIQWAVGPSNSASVEIDRIGLHIRERVGVAGVVVANQE